MTINVWPLAIITYADAGLKERGDGTRQAGATSLWRVRIHPDYAGDTGLRAHELVHVGQFWATGIVAATALVLAWVLFGDVVVAGIVCPPWALAPAALFGTHPALYRFSTTYRAWAEISAYRIQAASYNDGQDRLPKFAGFIATWYGLDIAEDDALRRLRK